VKKIDQFETFDFNFGRIMDFCNKIKNLEDQLIYLKWIIIELEHEGEDIPLILKAGYKAYLKDMEDQEKNLSEGVFYFPISWSDYKDFSKVIGKEIKYREKLLKLFESRKSTETQEKEISVETKSREEKVETSAKINEKISRSGMEKLLDINETSLLIGLAKGTIYKMITAKGIPYKKVGGKVMFSPLELHAWLKKKSVKPIRD
jgi:excisionase family DNA binding protein